MIIIQTQVAQIQLKVSALLYFASRLQMIQLLHQEESLERILRKTQIVC
nr:hypothetical protein Iba_scaffold110351CG0010 [Ipomoea batatas]